MLFLLRKQINGNGNNSTRIQNGIYGKIELELLQDALSHYLLAFPNDGYNRRRVDMLARLDNAVALKDEVHQILIKLGTVQPTQQEIDD